MTDHASNGLFAGMRLPGFVRRDQNDRARSFYDQLHLARPAIIAVGAPTSVLLELANENTLWEHVDRLAIVRAYTQSPKVPFVVLSDDGTLIRHLTGSGDNAIAVVDANARVLKRYSVDDLEGALRDVAENVRNERNRKSRRITRQAPVLLLPRVFEPTLCAELRSFFDETGGTPATVKPVARRFAKRRERVLDPARAATVRRLLCGSVLGEIQRCFQFSVARHEPFFVARYSSHDGGSFSVHKDTGLADTVHRRFAMTINLNTEAYEGGGVRFPEFGADVYNPDTGTAMVFSSELMHEAVAVASGCRYALVAFLF